MPYKIKHKSYNECLIEYVEDGPVREKSGVSLTMIVFGIVAVLVGKPHQPASPQFFD